MARKQNEKCHNMKFFKLWDLLNRKGMKKTDLLEIMSSSTLAKISKSEAITTEVIVNICEFLNCQPGDIMEIIPEQMGDDDL